MTSLAALQPLQGEGAPYLELAHQLRVGITTQFFDAGELLPNVRAVAAQIKTSPNTVSRAYQLLADEGLLEKTWRGYVVARAKDVSEIRQRRLRKAVRSLRDDLIAEKFTDAEINEAFKESIKP